MIYQIKQELSKSNGHCHNWSGTVMAVPVEMSGTGEQELRQGFKLKIKSKNISYLHSLIWIKQMMCCPFARTVTKVVKGF